MDLAKYLGVEDTPTKTPQIKLEGKEQLRVPLSSSPGSENKNKSNHFNMRSTYSEDAGLIMTKGGSPRHECPSRRRLFEGAQQQSSLLERQRHPLQNLSYNSNSSSPAPGILSPPGPTKREWKKKVVSPNFSKENEENFENMVQTVTAEDKINVSASNASTFFLSSSSSSEAEEDEENFRDDDTLEEMISRRQEQPKVTFLESVSVKQEEKANLPSPSEGKEVFTASAPATPPPWGRKKQPETGTSNGKQKMVDPTPSKSVQKLLARSQAVRTPECVEESKVQSWLSERMLSAVKRFVFQGTGDENDDVFYRTDQEGVASNNTLSESPPVSSGYDLESSSMIVLNGDDSRVEDDEGDWEVEEDDDSRQNDDKERGSITPKTIPPSKSAVVPSPFLNSYGMDRAPRVLVQEGGFPAKRLNGSNTFTATAPQDKPSERPLLLPEESNAPTSTSTRTTDHLRPWGAAGLISRHRPELRSTTTTTTTRGRQEDCYERLTTGCPPPAAAAAAVSNPPSLPPTPPIVRYFDERSCSTDSYDNDSDEEEEKEIDQTASSLGIKWVPLHPRSPRASPSSLPVSTPATTTTSWLASSSKPKMVTTPSVLETPTSKVAALASTTPTTSNGYILTHQCHEKENTVATTLVFSKGQEAPTVQGNGALLQEICLHGKTGKPALCRIPVQADRNGDGRFIVKVSVHYPTDEGDEVIFQVSPAYLPFGTDHGKTDKSQTSLNVRFVTAKAGEYTALLLLEYMGTRCKVLLRGIVTNEDESQKTPERAVSGGEDMLVSSTASLPPVVWRTLMIGCSGSRELVIRNCMKGHCRVVSTIEKDAGCCFHVDGSKQETVVGHDGVIRLVVSFRPTSAGLHEATLKLVVTSMATGQKKPGEERERVYSINLSGTAALPPPAQPSSSSKGKTREVDKTAVKDPFSLSGDSFVSMTKSSSSNNNFSRSHPLPAAAAAHKIHARGTTTPQDVSLRPTAVFFSSPILHFGKVEMGRVAVRKIPLCNPLPQPQLVIIEPVSLPFVIMHRCIQLKPRAFVRLPVRFVPVNCGRFSFTLHATVHPMSSDTSRDNDDDAPPSVPCSYNLMLELHGDAISANKFKPS